MKQNAQTEVGNSLKTVLETSRQALLSWRGTLLATTKTWANSKLIQVTTNDLVKEGVSRETILKLQPIIKNHLEATLVTHDYEEFYIVSRDEINLSTLNVNKVGLMNLLAHHGDFFEQIWKGHSVTTDLIRTGDVFEGSSHIGIFSGSPIRNFHGEIIGAFCFRVNPFLDFSKILKRGRIGKSGETYAVNKEGMLSSDSRFVEQLREIGLLDTNQDALLNIKVADPGINLLDNPLEDIKSELLLTQMARSVTNVNKIGLIQKNLEGYRDYRGVMVVGVWVWDKDLNLGITTEIDVNEAYSSFKKNKRIIEILIILTCSLLLIVFYLFDRNSKWLRDILLKRTRELEDTMVKEVELSNEKQELLLILERQVESLNTAALVSETDRSGRITYVNDHFCEVTGYSREELIGVNHRIVSSEQHPKEFWEKFWATLSRGDIWKGVVSNKSKSGEIYWVDSTIFPKKDRNGKINGYAAVSVNITEQQEIKNELEESVKLAKDLLKSKSDFLSTMSHEIRTPLNGILGIAEAMTLEELSAQNLEYLDLINYSGQNLLKIINEILEYSKLQAGKMSVHKHHFRFDTLIESINSCFLLQAESKGIEFIVEKSTQVPDIIYSDDTRIFQILNNIIGNAVKFTKEGFVKLEIDSINHKNGKNKLILRVSDTGVGMNEEALEKLFIPYEQAESTTDRYYGGTGLGLSIVSELLKLMNGEIDVKSSESGTVFEITLDYDNRDISENLDQKTINLPSDENFKNVYNYSFLVVEDNLINQKVIGVFLKKLGYRPEFANDGKEALRALRYKSYDIILMDMHMPELNGIETTKVIRREGLGNNPYIIALTANVSKSDKTNCINSGMNDFLSKPISLNALKKCIASIVSIERAS